MQGWITLCGWQAAMASVSFLIATMIQGLAVYNNPTVRTPSKHVPGSFRSRHGLLLITADYV